MEVCLTQALRDPLSYWYYVPRDILNLVLKLVRGALLSFRGDLVAVQQINLYNWAHTPALQGLRISPGKSIIARGYYSSIWLYRVNGTLIGRHQLKEKFRGQIKVTKDKVIYYSRKWIYHVSHDFKQRQKYLCCIDRLAGATAYMILPDFVLSGTNVLLSRYSDLPPGVIEVCYLTRQGDRYVCQVLATVLPGCQLFLNKHFALAVEYDRQSKIQCLYVYDFQRKQLIRQVLNLPPLVLARKLIRHYLVLSSDLANVIYIYNLLTQQMERTIPLETEQIILSDGTSHPIDYRFKHVNKQEGKYQFLMHSPYTHCQGYQVFM